MNIRDQATIPAFAKYSRRSRRLTFRVAYILDLLSQNPSNFQESESSNRVSNGSVSTCTSADDSEAAYSHLLTQTPEQ